MPLAGMATISM